MLWKHNLSSTYGSTVILFYKILHFKSHNLILWKHNYMPYLRADSCLFWNAVTGFIMLQQTLMTAKLLVQKQDRHILIARSFFIFKNTLFIEYETLSLLIVIRISRLYTANKTCYTTLIRTLAIKPILFFLRFLDCIHI